MSDTQTAPQATAGTALSPMQYLDRAMGALRDMGLMPGSTAEAPINALLEKISDLSPDKIAVITRTLGQAQTFNEEVRNEIQAMSIGDRYEAITEAFNSIRDDAKAMVDQLSDGKISFMESLNIWKNLLIKIYLKIYNLLVVVMLARS